MEFTTYTISSNGNPLFYVFNFQDGFIIVSADDIIFPIVAFSLEGNYTGHNLPPALEYWLNDLNHLLFMQNKFNSGQNEKVRLAWEKYSSDKFISSIKTEGVDPLILTKWNQGCYYNSSFSPEPQGPCGYLYTGCVATAMGQVMKFYNFPKSGTGSNSYNSNYGLQEADFENTVYGWADMQHQLNDSLLSDKIITGLTYTDFDAPTGSHNYKVQSVFIGNGNGPYDETEAYVSRVHNTIFRSIEVYPNPATNFIFINFDNLESDKINLSILNLNGRSIMNREFRLTGQKNLKVELPVASPGVYLLNIKYGSKLFSEKLLVK